MKPLSTALLIATLATATLAAVPAQAEKKKEFADTMVTVYVSAHGGGAIAEEMNEMHVKMEAAGWRFADVAIHVENEDTEGAWITYVK